MGQIDCLETEVRDETFAARVRENSGIDFNRCYQCLTCTLGCPFCFAMDFSPNQVVRMVQLGLKDKVLRSSAIWFCASCKACYTSCPHDVNIPRMMDALRQMALEAGIESQETSIPQLHRTFLRGIEQWGRQYEMGTLLRLKLKTGDLLGDLALGLKMLWKGKMPLFPPNKKGGDKLRAIFGKR
ncbi:4Fe-4S dicluster domain-containing protein [Bacteroidota bacterium]